MEKMEMILITGGTGFLGGKIAKFLKMNGYDVRIGTRKYNKKNNNQFKNFEIVEMDFLNKQSLLKACEGVSCIFHLADSNAQSSEKNPEEAIKINGIGTLNLVSAAIKKNIKKFIYFSTIHIYGDGLLGNATEKTLPLPKHAYGITSRLAEDFVLQKSPKDIYSIVLRLSNIVG